jgi:Domain of unknown function (DUF4430)
MPMKNTFAHFILALFSIFAIEAHAISYEVIGPCSATPLYKGTVNLGNFEINLGKFSMNLFDQQKIPYDGIESGFNSILNTPIGLEAMEVISDTKMRVYGWCYSVNGIDPDVMADKYFSKNNNDQLVWFYAYSTYDKGEWTDYCMPSYKIQAEQFCKK